MGGIILNVLPDLHLEDVLILKKGIRVAVMNGKLYAWVQILACNV